ncbi:MAG: SurA N-terminal domain-containing protein [Rhodospirillaceae bacterium]|nr:SurA N-terminal domain-containing protein [Rhodospirillaceae bacterium]
MLQDIRKGARSWLGIVLACILIPPFAIVGVEYVFRDGFSRAEAVITVGQQEVLGREYERAFRQRLDNLNRRSGASVDYRTAKSMGIVDLVAESFVGEALFRQATRDQGIVVGDPVVREAVRTMRAFQGVDGKFDPQLYRRGLESAQMSEPEFLDSQRAEIAAQYLVESIAGLETAPAAIVDTIDRFRNEKRRAKFFTLRAGSVTDLPRPDAAQLANFYAKHKERYRRPANRTVSVLIVMPEDVFDRIPVSAGEIETAYNRDKENYTTPEKRTLRQLLFTTEADALRVGDAMAGGKSFDTVANQVIEQKPLSLGTVTAADLPLPELADAAFARKQGEITAPVKSALGWHVIVVDKVVPAKTTPLNAVKANIEEAIKRKRAGDILDRLREDADDGLGADLSLDKIAGQIGMKLQRLPAIDPRGRNAAGEEIKGLPEDPRFLQRIFEQDTGRDDRDVVERKDGSFFIVQVDKISPSRIAPLEDVKKRVAADWTADARTGALKAKAEKLLQQLRAGAGIEAVAKRAGVSLKNSSPLNRYGAAGDSGVSGQLRDALFKAANEGAAVAEPGVNGYSVAVLTGIEFGGDAKQKRQTVLDSVKSSIGQELLAQYGAMLRVKYPVKIDREGIDRLFSRAAQRQQGS